MSRVTEANIIWFELPFPFLTFYANFLLFNRAIRYFGLQVHAAIKKSEDEALKQNNFWGGPNHIPATK